MLAVDESDLIVGVVDREAVLRAIAGEGALGPDGRCNRTSPRRPLL